ncbi:MAG: hypothetical protein ACREHV_05915 [Rhizomicrobium sp.]
MRVSAYYKLGRSQTTLDFVDVDISGDTRVFISPTALLHLPSAWGNECVSLIQNFFGTVLGHIRAGRQGDAIALLSALREPNETHLGLSADEAHGRALGSKSAREVWTALSHSEAAKSGLLEDLEDTVLMIYGISVDIVSDMTTDIIREPLIRYTQEVCQQYRIPLQDGVDSGPLWDPSRKTWHSRFEKLPVTPAGRLMLVPKAIVRRHLLYDAHEYYRHYLLEHLRSRELDANSSLVELLKNKKRRVTIKSLKEKYGEGKAVIVRETLRHPEILQKYRAAKKRNLYLPLTHEDLARAENRQAPNWDKLLANVVRLRPGDKDAPKYEKAIEGLLTALFYPNLTNPKFQHEIHEGRK